MYQYKLKEDSYTPKGFEIGDVEITKGRKSTVTGVDPQTGGITWSIEDIAAFDTVYKTFDKLRELLRTLETTGDAKEDTVIDTISDEAQDLFNKFRTHIRRTYPDAYEKIVTEGGNINESKKYKKGDKLHVKLKSGKEFDVVFDSYSSTDGMAFGRIDGEVKPFSLNAVVESLNEGSEDDEMAKTYIEYAEDDDLSGVEFSVSDNAITIWQETEIVGDDEEDEEPTKYKVWRESTDPALWDKLKKIALLHKNPNSLDEEEGIGYSTPKAFDKNKKSKGASDIYYYKLGYKPVPKKIKGSGMIVKKLWEKETLNEFSDFQKKRIDVFNEIEKKTNQISPLLSNAKSETVKYYNENPGSYDIKYSTDMIDNYVDNIIELLKQEEE